VQKLPQGDNQTDRGYASFLSSLRVFASQFYTSRTNHLGKQQQDRLLRNLSIRFQFPPVVRAMYTLITQRTPVPEDCAALAQCVFEYSKSILSTEDAPQYTFELAEAKVPFGVLYEQVRLGDNREDEAEISTPYLEAMGTQSLRCDITDKGASSLVCLKRADKNSQDLNFLDRKVVEYYRSGILRKTLLDWAEAPQVDDIMARLAAFSGGRFMDITYFKSEIKLIDSQVSLSDYRMPQTEQHKPTQSPLAVLTPKDLPSLELPQPNLTRDSTGTLSVYLGETKGDTVSKR